MTPLLALSLLAVVVLLLLWRAGRQTVAQLRTEVADLKKQEEAAQGTGRFLQGELADEKFGLSPKWTMAAEAREYRETLAIEKAIAEDPKKREAWVSRQLRLEVAASRDVALEGVSAEA